MNRDNLMRKGFVIGIIVLFVGASVTTSIGINIEKTNVSNNSSDEQLLEESSESKKVITNEIDSNRDDLFNDDFEDGTLNKWNIVLGDWEVISEDGNHVAHCERASTYYRRMVSKAAVTDDIIITAKIKGKQWQGSATADMAIGFYSNSDASSFYSVGIGHGNYLAICRFINNGHTVLTTNPDVISYNNIWYNLKIQLEDGNIYAKRWEVGSSEPSNWQISYSDVTIYGNYLVLGGSLGQNDEEFWFDDIIANGGGNQPPTADFEIQRTNNPSKIQFTATGQNLAGSTLNWDYDNDGEYEESGSFEQVGTRIWEYPSSEIYHARLFVNNSAGSDECINKFAVLRSYDISCSNDDFFLSYPTTPWTPPIKNKYTFTCPSGILDHVTFKLGQHTQTDNSPSTGGGNDIWEAVLNMNEGDRGDKVQILGYDNENDLVWEDEVDTFILITPPWFDVFLLASDISVYNSDNYDYWSMEIVPPNIGLGYAMDNVPVDYIGGKYGVNATVTGPQTFTIESSEPLTVYYPLCSLDIPLGSLGNESALDLGSYAGMVEWHVGVNFAVSADVQIDPSEVSLAGRLTLRGEAGVSFDIPIAGIPFLAEVGLTGGVDAELGTTFVIARLGEDGFTFCPDGFSEVFFGIDGHAGIYAEVLWGLGRLEGGLYAGGKLSMKLPSLQKHMRLYGGVYAKACCWIWCAEWSCGIEFEASDGKLGLMRTTDLKHRTRKNIDLLCLKQFDREPLGSSNDSSTLLAGNVAGNAYPKIVLTDDGSGLAVWTDITPIDNTSFQSDIWWSVYNGTAWRTPQGMNTSSSCELNPILEIISDEDSNQSVVMTYLTIDDVVDVNDSVETFYENITIDTAIWTNTSGWSFSGGNISVSSGTVNTMEICDGGNNTVYMTYLVDSNVHPWENGNGSIYVVRGGINNSMVEWEDPVLVKYLGSSLNYSCQPGVSFPYSDAGGVVYSWWNKTSGMNETVLLATTSGFNDSNCTELIIRETHLSIKHVSSNIVNGSVVVCWVENRSSICSREILVNESDDPVNWTLGNITMVYSGLSISYVKPVYSDNKSFYLFQAGEGFTPFVIERLANGSWGHVRRISLARSYSLGHLDGDSNDVMSQMIYTCDIPVNSWQAGHWRFNEGDGNITADNSDFDNDGTIIGFSSVNSSVLWVKNNNISGNLSEDYGYCLRFINESGFVEVPYNSSLDVSDEFTLCSWIRLNSCSNGTRLVGRNGSWVVFEDNGSLGLKLWRENGTAVLSNITELPLDTWSFIAVRYDHGLVNVSMFPSGFDNVSEEYQLDDIDVNITNSSLIIGGFNGSVDETRLFNRDVTGSVIDSIWFAPYATLGSLHDIMVQQMPSFACFNFTTGRMDNGNITTEDVVEFTGSPSGFNFSWDFGDGTAAVGEVVTHQYNKPGFYIVVCNATDPSNGVVTPSVETLYVSDATVPVFNGLESAVASNCSVILVWDPALDNGSFVQYHVYMKEEGESFNYSNPCLIVSDTSCIISNLTANTTYYFVVRAKDSAGNMDDNTVEKSAIPFDAIPPVFEGLKLAYNISNVPGSVFLEWEAAVDMSPPVTYNVYMSNVTGGQNFSSPFNVTNITWYQLGGLENQLYYFVVRAEDTWSNEDNNTAEISVRPFIDVAAPEIMDVQAVPSAQGSGGWVNISCNVTDNARIDLVMVNITLPSSSYLNQTMTHILYTCTYYYNASYIIPGLYSYFIWANDTNGNANTSTVYNFTILDTESPTITDYTVGIGYTGDMFAFNATITDLGGVSTAWVEYWYGIGTHTNVSMNNVAGDYWEKTLVIDDTLDILHYIISANDTSNNWNNTGVKNVTIYDNDEPEITDVQADPLEQKIGGYVNISAVVTDNIEVDEVYLYIEYPDSSIENFSITQNRTGDMYHCNKTYHQLGVHTYHIWANDTSGNSNVSADYSFEIIPHGPDLCCDGALYWEDVVPGEVVEGEFEVWNCGDNFSELDWEITEWPDWGDDWSFDPASGEGLTPEAGHVTVTVEVKAPDVENEEFTGTIVICNSEDPGNCCEIEVTLITPYDLPFLQFLAQRFPILARILSLIL